MVRFLIGCNNGWFGGKYANDLGHNQFSGSELWHWPYDQPVPIDLTLPEANPAKPLLSEQPALVQQFFQKLNGIDVVRIWLFERLEGIRFDANRKIIGIDQDLLNNLMSILNAANANNVKVYLCLFDSWVVKNNPPSGLPQSRLPNYQSWNTTIRNLMKDIIENPFDFTEKVLKPLVNQIANHPAVYAIDLMNEPEGMVEDTPAVSNAAMRNYVVQCSNIIKPRLKVSIGCMRRNTAKGYSDLPVDFCDFHSYNETGTLDSYVSSDFRSKPCVIGECGYPVSSSNSTIRKQNEVSIAQEFVNQALNKGYSTCLVWNQDFVDPNNNDLIIQWMKQFAGSNNEVKAPRSLSFFELLLRFFGLI